MISVVSIVVVSVINWNWMLLYQTTYYRIVVKGSKSELRKKYSLCCLVGCKYFSTFSYKIYFIFNVNLFIYFNTVSQGTPGSPGLSGRTSPDLPNYSGRGQLGKSSNEYPLIVVLVVFVVLNHIYLKLMPFHSAAFTFQNGNNRPLFFRIATLHLKASPRHNSERDTKCSDTL